ncbi:hypothetical protein ScPMuIL_011071 [Solemya velum]
MGCVKKTVSAVRTTFRWKCLYKRRQIYHGNGWMNAVWAGDPLAFTGAPEGYYVPYVEIDCDWDYWIESYWKDVIASEKAATGTSDVTFGSTDEQGTYSNSETGLDNGLEPNADPYAVHGAPRRLYDPYPEFRSYKESRNVKVGNLEGETTPVEQRTSSDCENRLDEPFAIYTPPRVLYKPYLEFEYEKVSHKTGSTKRKRTDHADEMTEHKYSRTNGCFA